MISLLCPTRKRPDNMQRVWESALTNAYRKSSLEILFYIDNDDTASIAKLEEMRNSAETGLRTDHIPHRVRGIIGNRILLSETWNMLCKIARGSIYGFICDEAVFRTNGWDSVVRDAFYKHHDSIMFVYGRDGIWDGKQFGAYGFVHQNWVNVIGYLAPPYFSCDYNDTWLNDVAKKIGRHYEVDILIEHMHPLQKKAVLDETHRERRRRGKRDNVKLLYESLAQTRNKDAQKLLTFIEDYGDIR